MGHFFSFCCNAARTSEPGGKERLMKLVRPGQVLVILVLLSAACRPVMPSVPTYPDQDEGFALPAAVILEGLPNDSPPPNVIMPGDVVALKVLSAESSEPTELWVDAIGRVHVPFAGDVEVKDLGLGEAEARIVAEVRRYDKFARIALAIQSFSGHRVTVTGAVEKPGTYEARPGARVTEMIASAGGTRVLVSGSEAREAADLEAARVVRSGTALPISVGRALVGDPLHNVYVRSGDVIFVPWAASNLVPVLGEVNTSRNVPFHPGLRLTEALAAAGGITRSADKGDVRVIRGPLSRPKVYRASVEGLIAGKTGDIVLAPGDVVFVTEHVFATVTDIMNRVTPFLAAVAVTSALAR